VRVGTVANRLQVILHGEMGLGGLVGRGEKSSVELLPGWLTSRNMVRVPSFTRL
jgi:hypothetical protein